MNHVADGITFESQSELIMHLLKTRDRVSGYDLVFKFGIKQAPTRIYELRQKGIDIQTIGSDNKNSSEVFYKLNQKPQETLFPIKEMANEFLR